MTTAKSAEFWEQHVSNKKAWIRGYGEGVGTASRDWLLTVVHDGESLLDVGCGPGCTYENLKVHDRRIEYLGLDVAQGFVDACRELFPEGDFRQGSAMALNHPDRSWDTVLLRHVLENTPNFETPIAEALRVARKRVVIVMWRPLIQQPSRIRWPQANDYNEGDFLGYVKGLLLPLRYEAFGGQRPNWAWVIYKQLDECVFDVDDLEDEAPNVDILRGLKAQFPALKATLFAIPARMQPGGVAMELGREDWVELGVHGWCHDPNRECLDWDRDDARRYLDKAEAMGCFVRGFRPPGWLVSDDVLDELAERGYWVAVHKKDAGRAEKRGLRYHLVHKNYLAFHAHFIDIRSKNPVLRNGLRQLTDERGFPWGPETRFRFISEVVNGGVIIILKSQ